MLHRAEELEGFTIHAEDGELGKIEDVYFDDAKWTIRYFIVRTGSWLFGKEVLLSPLSMEKIEWHAHEVRMALTMEEVENSPAVETKKPVSKHEEAQFVSYFGHPVYWGGASLWGSALYPAAIFAEPRSEASRELEEMKKQHDHHLRSVREVRNYRLDTMDDEIGRVTDFIFDDETLAVRYMEVKTGKILGGRQLLISPSWIEQVNWAEGTVGVDMRTEIVENAPAYDPSEPIDREYENKLFEYYGRAKYWLNTKL
mgnify:CR=1 FL=1